MTTNGVGLAKKAAPLKAAGLTRINVSLDSLHEETFTKLTRRPFLDQVLAGVDAAWAAGLGPVKLNAVLMRGINDAESPALLAWAVGPGVRAAVHRTDAAGRRPRLDPAEHDHRRRDPRTALRGLCPERRSAANATARRPNALKYDAGWPGIRRTSAHGPVLGTVGIIASVTEPFCSDCRRTRITAEGKIMSCLFSREEFDLLGLLRSGRRRRRPGAPLAGRHVDQAQSPRHGPRGTRRTGLRPAGPQHERHRGLTGMHVRYFAAARAAAGLEEERSTCLPGQPWRTSWTPSSPCERQAPPGRHSAAGPHPGAQQLPAERGGGAGPCHGCGRRRRRGRPAAVRRRVAAPYRQVACRPRSRCSVRPAGRWRS